MRILLRVPLLCLLLISGCDSAEVKEWPTQKGQVVDEMTGEGIADAIVVARWKGTAAYSTTVCFHVESTTTDKRGRYEIPAWRNDTRWRNTGYQHVAITVYKAGHEESDKTIKTQSHKEGIYYQKLFSGPVVDRMDYLSRVSIDCHYEIKSRVNVLPLYRALYSEAKSIAVTKDEQLQVLYRLRDVERIELGSDEAWKRFRERECMLK